MKKRILTMLMALCVCFTSIPADVTTYAGEAGIAQEVNATELSDKDTTETGVSGGATETASQTTEAATEETGTTGTESSEAVNGTETSSETSVQAQTETETEKTTETEITTETETQTEAVIEETEATEQTEETETEETETEEEEKAAVNFIMVESDYLETPGTQNVVASVGTEKQKLSNLVLTYKNQTTGQVYNVNATAQAQDMALFTMNFSDDSQSGAYQLLSVAYQLNKKEYTIALSKEDMKVTFGVNTKVETNPDQVLRDEDPSVDANVDADVVTMDENGNVVSKNTVEDVINNGISSLPLLKGSKLKGANGNIVVVLDPGHDDTHAGAQAYGAGEEDLVLKIAAYCKEELSQYQGVTVYMTRETGACPNGGSSVSSGQCNESRVAFAANKGANVYVSFHLNSSTSASANGVGVYYPNSSYNAQIGEIGKGLATDIYNKLAALGLRTWGDSGIKIWNATYDKYDDGSTADYLGVIRNCKKVGIPAVLIEHAFLSNYSDYVNYLNSDEKLKKLGVADATAIAEYYNLSKEAQKPVITYTQSRKDGGLKIKWNAFKNAVRYEVYRDTQNAYNYAKIATVSNATYYIDYNVQKDTKYYYLIRAIYADGSASEYSAYNTGFLLDATEISYVKSKSTRQLQIAWDKVSGAEGYVLYRKDSANGSFAKVATITSGSTTSYVDSVKADNNTYSYKIQAYNTNNGTQGVGPISGDKAGKSVAKPTISSVVSKDETSLTVNWKKVGGAEGYILQRSTSKDSGYKTVKTIKSADTVSYLDTVSKGKTYYYRIQAYNTNDGARGYSGYSDGFIGKTVAKTTITSVVSKNETDLVVSWKKVSGATGYDIKRSTSKTGTYTKIKAIKSGSTTSFQDKTVTAGQTYYYKVETLAKSNGKTGRSGDSAAVAGKTIAKAKINYVVSKSSTSLEIGWGEVSGAWGYRVKRSTAKKGTYEIIKTIKGRTETSYTDKVSAGQTYYYKVEAINTNSGKKGYSGDSNIVSGKSLTKTTITSVKANSSTSLSLSWKKVNSASGYHILRSTSKTTGYAKVATVSGETTLSYKDTNLEPGKIYYYKVRAYRDNKYKTGMGTNSSVQKAWTLSVPEITGGTSTDGNKVTLKWNKVLRASGYDIYRSTSKVGGYKKIKNISSGSTVKYEDTGVAAGTIYYYKIKAITKIVGGKTGASNISNTVEVPVLAKVTVISATLKENNTAQIVWTPANNVSGYQLYCSQRQDGGYQPLTTTSNTSYNHSGIQAGATYYYKVRAYLTLSDGNTVYGVWSNVKAFTAGHTVMGTGSVTVSQMVNYYNARYTFPSSTYKDKGASTAAQFFTILKEEAEAEGVRPELLFAQVILETGGLTFKGDVRAEQCNFGGLGATGNGVAGETFADVRTGLRAQTQHLKAYGSTAALNNACVDTRFNYVARGCAPYIEWLSIPNNPYGKGWAVDANYAPKILKIMQSL